MLKLIHLIRLKSDNPKKNEMTQKFKAAAAAMRVVHDKSLNLEQYRRYVKQCAQEGVRLLALPEGSLQGFIFHTDHRFDPQESNYVWENSEAVPGPSTSIIVEWAVEHDLYIIFSLWERVDHSAMPVFYNSAVLVGPEGFIGKYRKVHQPFAELQHYRPGRDWPVYQTSLAKLGMMICYDQCFPEAARELALQGADVLAVPSAWRIIDQASMDRYDFFGRARAAENNRWVVQSNQVGPSGPGGILYLGNSRIIDPSGVVVACTPDKQEGLAIAQVLPLRFDPDHADSGRYLQHRVPKTYTRISDTAPYE